MTTYLLWCDLETTGLDHTEDEILEAAFILTDTDLNELTSWHATFQPSANGWKRLVANTVVREMHLSNGLITDILTDWNSSSTYNPWPAVHEFDRQINDTLTALQADAKEQGDTFTSHLAGSGIAAFDRPLINRHMIINTLLHYAPIDVGVLKRTWRMWTDSDISGDNDNKTHRAMDDVEGHLREARLFRDVFRSFLPDEPAKAAS